MGSDLPSFEVLTSNRIIHAIKNTRIIEVNASSGKTPEIRWNDFYSHILIGGQAMDRGFTVEGLTVTYMPRSLATGQIDTTLQRARFFGYKGNYLGFCRVWMDQNNIEAFRAIIEHEEDVRRRLQEYDLNNKHLDEWERKVVKGRILKLTRPNIIYDDLDRDYFGAEWFNIRAPHDTDSLILENQKVVSDFYSNNIQSFNENEGHLERTNQQKHLESELSLEITLDNLLSNLKFTRESDSQSYSSLQGILYNYLNDNPGETCKVIAMSSSKIDDEIFQITRKRSLRDDLINGLFQGEQPTRDGRLRKGEQYPGDRFIRDDDKITIQIHRLHLTELNGDDVLDENDNLIYEDVPSIAIWIPELIGKDIVRQPDNTL